MTAWCAAADRSAASTINRGPAVLPGDDRIATVQDFAEAIQDGRDPVVTGQDGRAAVEIVEAADRSAATHQAVTLPLSG